jgi:hypothetical protein
VESKFVQGKLGLPPFLFLFLCFMTRANMRRARALKKPTFPSSHASVRYLLSKEARRLIISDKISAVEKERRSGREARGTRAGTYCVRYRKSCFVS